MKVKRNSYSFFAILGLTLLAIAMLLLLATMVNCKDFAYWLVNVIIVATLLIIDFHAFRLYTFKAKEDNKDENKDEVDSENKDTNEQ